MCKPIFRLRKFDKNIQDKSTKKKKQDIIVTQTKYMIENNQEILKGRI